MARPYLYNPETRPICVGCSLRPVARMSHAGKCYWRKYCQTCAKAKYTSAEKKKKIDRKASAKYYQKFRDSKLKPCTLCSFMPKYAAQMDWDHIDGNHYNNNSQNLQLLCANCHRAKSIENQDFKRKDYGIM